MPSIFVSFRKADNRWMRDRVYQALSETFGPDEVFKSGESIPPGGDYAAILRRQAAECKLMAVLIGTSWTDARDFDGTRLLDRQNDWVRTEIATALASGNRVVPVLLGDAAMLPAPVALPDDIADLAHLQFLRVAETHLDESLRRFTTAISQLLPELPTHTTTADSPTEPNTTTTTGAVSTLPAASTPPPASPPAPTVTQTTGTGNAVAVQGTARNARIAGGDIRETKIHTGGLITTAISFLTSKASIATAAAIAIGTGITIATTSNNKVGTTGTTPRALNAAGSAAISGGVTLGDDKSGFASLPKGWQLCPNDPNDSSEFPSAVDAGTSDCGQDPVLTGISGAILSVGVVGQATTQGCIDNGGSTAADVSIPPAVATHLKSLAPYAEVRAGHNSSAGGNYWGIIVCVSLSEAKSSFPGDTCFQTIDLAGNAASMESEEPALWEAAQTVRLGSYPSCD